MTAGDLTEDMRAALITVLHHPPGATRAIVTCPRAVWSWEQFIAASTAHALARRGLVTIKGSSRIYITERGAALAEPWLADALVTARETTRARAARRAGWARNGRPGHLQAVKPTAEDSP